MPRSDARTDLLAAVVLLLMATGAFVHRIFFDGADEMVFANSDLFRYFNPLAEFFHESIRRGELPFWNPYQLAGVSLLASHEPALLYPPNLLAWALFRGGVALAVLGVLHLWIAGVFAWLLAARLGLSFPARATAALGFMFGGLFFRSLIMPFAVASGAWFPAVLWALHGLLTDPRPRWSLALAASLSLPFLAGHAQVFLYIAQISAVFGLAGVLALTPSGERLRVLGWAGVAVVLAICFIAPQLLPTLELLGHSVRGFEGVSFESAAGSKLDPADLRLWLAGGLGGGGRFQYFLLLPYLGVPLIACGAVPRPQRRAFCIFLGLAAVLGVFVLGSATPFFALYYALPLGNMFRYGPLRAGFLFMFAIAMLTAFGVHGVREILIAHLPKGRLQPLGRWFPSALALLIGASLYGTTHLGYRHPVRDPRAVGLPTPVVDFMRNQSDRPRLYLETLLGLYSHDMLYKSGSMNRIFVVPDYDANLSGAYEAYFAPRMESSKEWAPWHGKLSLFFGYQHHEDAVMDRLLDLMSVRYVASVDLPKISQAVGQRAGGRSVLGGETRVFERPTALPRLYVVREVAAAANLSEALTRIEASDFRPREQAVVTVAHALPEALASLNPHPAAGDVAAITRYETDEVVAKVTCDSPCLLVLTDLHYPGWSVHVDQTERELLQTNAIFRGVWLAAGTHDVVFRFRPKSFYIGLSLSFLALSAVAVFSRCSRRI